MFNILDKLFVILKNFLKFINISFVFVIFFGMILVAAMGLIALSPIGFEDYWEFSQKQESFDKYQDSTQQVAGVVTQDPNIRFINLLENKEIEYEFIQEDNNLSFRAKLDLKNQSKNEIKILKIDNLNNYKKSFYLNLNFNNQDSYKVDLFSNIELKKTTQGKIIELNPHGSATILLNILEIKENNEVDQNKVKTSVLNFDLKIEPIEVVYQTENSKLNLNVLP